MNQNDQTQSNSFKNERKRNEMNQNDQETTKEMLEDQSRISDNILELHEIKRLITDLCEIKSIFRKQLQTSMNVHHQQTIESMWKYYLEGLETIDDLKGFVKILKDTDNTISNEYVLCDIKANENGISRDFRITRDQERKGSI